VECEPHRRLKLWIYDLWTNKHFTLNEPSSSEIDWRSVSPKGQRCSADQNPLKRSDLDDLESPAVASHPLRVACYNPKNRHERKESERFIAIVLAKDSSAAFDSSHKSLGGIVASVRPVSARNGKVRVLQKAARMCLRCA